MNALSRFLARLIVLRLLALLCVLIGAANPAVAAKTYSDNGDGTVTDPTTGLTWTRCAMGQTWTGSTCTGTATGYTWTRASALTGTMMIAGLSHWRLPNIRELQTIADRSRYSPAIDSLAFPNTPSASFWSASAYAGNSNLVWFVDFRSGYVSYDYKEPAFQVRLVRGGQSLGLLDLARPTSDFAVHGDGTVTHTPTGLVWRRCAVGQTWADNSCGGDPTQHNWDTALAMSDGFAGHSDWRLPTEDELLSLVDYTLYNAAVNATIFPGSGGNMGFWSASADASFSYNAWLVGFGTGSATSGGKVYGSQVRLVRAGQSLDAFALAVTKVGNGSVTGSALTGMTCGSTCAGTYTSGTSVTLIAIPEAGSTFAGWSGACSGTGTCTVSMNQAQSVTATFTLVPVSSANPYDGIYLWDDNHYLSVHQIGGGTLIGTIYWNYTANSVQIGARTIPTVDTFDLFHGQIVGSNATISGPAFYRACTLSYDLTFNPDSSLTVRLNSVTNSPGVNTADVDCAARYNPVGSVWTIPRIF